MGRDFIQILLPIFIIFSSIAGKNLTIHGRYNPQNRELLDVKICTGQRETKGPRDYLQECIYIKLKRVKPLLMVKILYLK